MNERILVVDDRTDTINLVSYALNSLGHVVFSAPNGKRCLDIISKKPVDLILLDVMMPGLSGKEVLQKIRENKEYNKIKIIMLTAVRYSTAEQHEFIKLGAQGFLTRPISIEQLEKEVKKILKAKARAPAKKKAPKKKAKK